MEFFASQVGVSLFAATVGAFIFGLFFALGVAVASRILPVVRKQTYDNLDKPNAPKRK